MTESNSEHRTEGGQRALVVPTPTAIAAVTDHAGLSPTEQGARVADYLLLWG